MRTAARSTSSFRSGFTLIELLVAAALTVLVMYVMATAFQAATSTLGQLRSVCNLAEQLGAAQSVMKRDLSAPHLYFSGIVGTNPFNGPVALTDTIAYPDGMTWNTPGTAGFFKVVQGSQGVDEGQDVGIHSYRCTDHWLHFSVRSQGADPVTTFYGAAPPTTGTGTGSPSGPDFASDPANRSANLPVGNPNHLFGSQWAEVMLYLVQPASKPMTSDPTNPLALYVLCRRQLVVAEQGLTAAGTAPVLPSSAPPDSTQGNWPEISTQAASAGGPWKMNTPSDLTTVNNRLLNGSATPTTFLGMSGTGMDYTGFDILLTNVISMQIQVLQGSGTTYTDPAGANWPKQFDTATTALDGPMPANTNRLRAVRITLRIYDPKNQITRQMTLAQAL